MTAADDLTVFDNNTRFSNPAGARKFRFELGLVRAAARLVPLLPPVVALKNTYYILGHDDAVDALSADTVFATPYKQAMREIDSNGEVSLLGFDSTEDTDYQKNLCQVMRAMPLDIAGKMGVRAAALTAAKLQEKGARLDFMADLLIPITLDVTREYYGVRFDPPFYKWTLAALNYTFSPPRPPAYERRAAIAAGHLMDAALKYQTGPSGTILGAMQDAGMDTKRIQPTLAGLLVGTLPTITQAGFNIMKVLLAQPKAMAMARAAAQGDDDRLRRCLSEALRFRPVLPVIFRKCVIPPESQRPADQPVRPLDWRKRHIPSGADVGIFCLTANFDARRVEAPYRFDPDRPRSDNLAFGHGKHWCLGVSIALDVLAAVFRPLLLRGPIRVPKDAEPTRYFLDSYAQNLTITLGGSGQ